MLNENLRLFTSPTTRSDQHLDLATFDFKTLDTQLLAQVLRLPTSEAPAAHLVTVDALAKGFNLEITGGGIHKISVTNPQTDKPSRSMILKAIPPFAEQQSAMFEALDKLEQQDFIDLLAKYPSNQLSLRELHTYAFLADRIALPTPELFLGILDQLTEQAWIFMEDLSELTTVTADTFHWKYQAMKTVVRKIADFHAGFWGQDSELKKQTWLGNWWNDRNNDFVAEDVTAYALETCARLHPDVLTPARLSFITTALKNRPAMHAHFQEQPQTLIHWDMGPHNMKLDQRGSQSQPTVFDWELTSVGVAQWDLAQFLLPILGGKDQEQVLSLVDEYLSALPAEIAQTIDTSEFLRVFDLVVLDHFFRVCGPVVFAGSEMDDNNIFFKEWQHCLEWIESRLMTRS